MRRAILALASAALLCLNACAREEEAAAPEAQPAQPVTAAAERGPVTITVRADKGQFSIADTLSVTVTVEAEQDVDVRMPEFLQNVAGIDINDYHVYGPEVTADKKNRWRQEYELEVDVSGEYEIPPFTAKFLDKREETAASKDDEGEVEWNELQTEGLKVTATSLVQPAEELTEIRDIMAPVSLPKESFIKRHALLIGTALGAIAAAGGAAFLILRRREIKKQMLPAHVIAFRMLEWLIAQGLVEQGRPEEFYVRLCNVVRKYIELRFAVHAPEETTEEFLEQLASGEVASLLFTHRTLLKDFLEHADLVKFARHTPGNAEVQKSFDSAKTFIQETSDETVLVEAAAVAGGVV